jgi:hypothetical protein
MTAPFLADMYYLNIKKLSLLKTRGPYYTMQYTVSWLESRNSKPIEVGTCASWTEANNMLTCVDSEQYFAVINDGDTAYHFLVTKGAGPLEVIALQDYPNMSIYDVLLKR